MNRQKKKVCIFTLYSKEGASSNFRILMFVDDLKKHYDVITFSFWNKNFVTKYMNDKKKFFLPIGFQYIWNVIKRIYQILFIASKSDIVIFQKSVIPKVSITYISYLKKKGCKIIFDVDDAIYMSLHDNSDEIAKKADVIVVGNDVLMKHYSLFNKNTVLFPTVDYSPEYKKYICNTFKNKCIGWIGSKATINNLDIVVNAINKVVNEHPEVKFEFICDDKYGYIDKIKNSIFTKWTLDGYKKEVAKFTIGIMPLEDTEYNRGKCGFKLIQYMNLYKPVIASPVGINSEIVGNGGLIAKTEDEWIYAIKKLLFNKKEYEKCIDNIRNEFEKNYSYERLLLMWINLINKI
ncbi:glycosyltransferase [Clostridium perfringens]|uniref:glycosyltransferase n=1 Tax=Clostridium perfringens TaxID=1502 RepID=UPI0018E449B5|nr:glycosyltransferase [Clostridium perfringens]